MKKLMSILLGLTLVAGTAVIGFAAEEQKEDATKKETKKKKSGKKKKAETPETAPKQ